MAGSDSAAQNGRPPVGDLSYTEASRELDDIVRFFEQRDVDVDQLVGRLERATAIVDELDRRLRRTRAQVEELVPRLAAILSPERGHDDAESDRAAEPEGVDEPERVDEPQRVDDPAEAAGDVPYDDGDPGPTEPQGLF